MKIKQNIKICGMQLKQVNLQQSQTSDISFHLKKPEKGHKGQKSIFWKDRSVLYIERDIYIHTHAHMCIYIYRLHQYIQYHIVKICAFQYCTFSPKTQKTL